MLSTHVEIFESIGRPSVALALGSVIGFERQWRQKMAGLRTNALVALGSCGFVVLSAMVGQGDPTRVAAQVVTRIGFLGAGIILREGINVHGVNTAATLWCSAMVGTFAGAGLWAPSLEAAGVILGQAGTATTPLFRALAGLRLRGAGRVALPVDETLLCIPRNAYLPPGTLREILAYPSPVATFAAEAFPHALERLGLDRLVPMLDQSRRWDRILSEGEQHSLAFARAVIHAPPWLLIDQVLDSLDDDTRQRVGDVMVKDLAASGIIHIGRTTLRTHLFGRVLHLVKDPQAHCFRRLVASPG